MLWTKGRLEVRTPSSMKKAQERVHASAHVSLACLSHSSLFSLLFYFTSQSVKILLLPHSFTLFYTDLPSLFFLTASKFLISDTHLGFRGWGWGVVLTL